MKILMGYQGHPGNLSCNYVTLLSNVTGVVGPASSRTLALMILMIECKNLSIDKCMRWEFAKTLFPSQILKLFTKRIVPYIPYSQPGCPWLVDSASTT